MSDEHTQQTLEAVYTFIQNYIAKYSISPSLREISKGCFMSTSTIYRYLDKLEAEGRIIRYAGQARSISLHPDQ
jgi:DeoR/GlpR family transcriptional regulator of sugar metabolism